MPDLFTTLRDALAGRYAVERELGRGGMATVFLAQDVKHHRPVAIKVVHPELAAGLGADRFLREIEIAARLQHPHILPLYDSGRAAEFLYYVMPFVEGESLRDRLDREKQLPLEDALRITSEVAGALAYAHGHGVVHRDIKPENIMLSGGSAVVADFGIARAFSAADQQHLTQTGAAIGTPAYMSPEQATASAEIDGRSDQYSLACVLYEMLVGQPPFTGPTPQAVMARHSLDQVSPPSIVRATIPDTVEHALLRALAKVPADRFPTTALFAEAVAAPGVPVGVRRTTRAASTTPWLAAVPRWAWGVGAVSAVILAGALVLSRRAPPSRHNAGGLDPRHVAVLYFQDLSARHDLGHLADGLTEALIGELGQVRTLDVISRNGVGQFRGGMVPRDSIARALRVGTLVDGSVEDAGDRLRVAVRLVDGPSGTDIDRKTFERAPGDLLAIRDSLTQQVAVFLRQRLGEEVRLREERGGTGNVDAWLLVQRAEKLRKEARVSAARDSAAVAAQRYALADSLLAQAASLDPAWVGPIVERARVSYLRGRLERAPRDVDRFLQVGLGYANRALDMDPKHPDALELRGTMRYVRFLLGLEPDPAAAERLLASAESDLVSATRLNPGQVGAWSALSHLYYQKRDRVEANRAARSAYEADAYLEGVDEILWRLYTTSYDLELWEQGVDWCDKGQRRFPTNARFVTCQLELMTSAAREPDVAEAWRLAEEVVARTPERAREYTRLESRIRVAGVIARAGLADSARRVLERSQGNPEIDPQRELLGWQAVVRTMLGDRDDAIRLLGEYLVANPRHREGFRKHVHWWWRRLQGDPRFQALVAGR